VLHGLTARKALREILDGFDRNDLLTFASAIAFQVFFALIPLVLFALGLMGGLGLQHVWTNDAAPKLQADMSGPAFTVLDTTVRKVLLQRQTFWMTFGAVITVWEISGAVRAVMDVFDRIYDADRKRAFKERYLVSIALSIGVGVLLLGAVALVQLGPLAVSGPLALLRYPLAALLLLATVALLVRVAPATPQPAGWVSFGSIVVVVAWLGTSLVFTAYLTNVANYGSIFGNLATVIVIFEYLYLSSIAFLAGAQIDAIVREAAEGDESGDPSQASGGGDDDGPRLVLPTGVEVGRG
jgi:membrane protein